MAISFIHCGDIHLGFNQFNSQERFDDFYRSFAYIVDYAIEKQVDYLLISGDFFNKRSINPSTLGQAIEQLERLKEKAIRVIAIEGNHDKAPYSEPQSWMSFLNEQGYFYLLSPDFKDGAFVLKAYQRGQGGSLLAFPGIRFVGLGYQGSMTAHRLAELNEQLEVSKEPTILLLHSAVDRLMHLGGISYQDILALKDKVDYVAMGHVHQRYELEDWIYNPGCPESWDLGEGSKEKGFYHVSLAKEGKRVDFIQSKRRPVLYCTIDASDCRDLKGFYELCEDELAKLDAAKDSKPIVRLVLEGALSFSPLLIDSKLLEERIVALFDALLAEVVNNTVLKGEGWEALGSAGQVSREELERRVLHKLFLDRGEFEPWVTDLVDTSKGVKELIRQGAENQSISAIIERLAVKMIEREGQSTDEDS